MRLRSFSCFLFLMMASGALFAQQTIPLYEKNIPGALNGPDEEKFDSVHIVTSKVSKPALTVYLPEKARSTGAAVLICPGGGYRGLVIGKEGYQIARYFSERGVAAFVLKYRLPDDKIMKDKSIGPLQDAQQAIRLIKQRAGEWNIDTARVGIMGFSAGGHLASTVGTHFDRPVLKEPQAAGVRPAFMILVYPVISMTDSLGHRGSRNNLLGMEPTAGQKEWYSNELQVTPATPPAFLLHAGDDIKVDVDNSILFYEALRHNKVPAEMHIYPKGDHGFVFKMPMDEWMGLCMKWLKESGYLH